MSLDTLSHSCALRLAALAFLITAGGIAARVLHRWVLVFGQLHQDGGQAIGVAHLLVVELLLPLFTGRFCGLVGGNVVLAIHQRWSRLKSVRNEPGSISCMDIQRQQFGGQAFHPAF